MHPSFGGYEGPDAYDFDEFVERLAAQFTELEETVRLRSLAFANSLIVDRGVDPASALKTVSTINDGVHRLIIEKAEYPEGTPPMAAAIGSFYEHMWQMMFGSQWCGHVEANFIQPLMCALAVEVQHQR